MLLTLCAVAQQGQILHIRGFVTDANTRETIAGVAVTSVLARHSATTDANGFFSLELREGVRPGAEVRIHLEKQGYRVDDLTEAASEDVTYPISLSHLASSQGKRPPKSFEPAPQKSDIPPFSSVRSVRDEGLTLYREISTFLEERQRNDPSPRQAPGWSSAGCEGETPNPDRDTPVYMQETRKLFEDKFQGRIAEIHDELSSMGLQNSELEVQYKCAGRIFGNVDTIIKRLADSIRNLAALVPPKDLYVGLTDEKLAVMALDEAGTVDDKVRIAMDNLEAHNETPDAWRFHFFYDFKECCLNQVEYLRAELLRRLGPSAYDSREMQAFNGVGGLTEMDKQPTASIATASEYAPYFRRLAVKMKRKAVPLSPPVTLRFAETQLGPQKIDLRNDGPPATPKTMEFPHNVMVTLQAPKETTSGYVIVSFDSHPAMMSSDLTDAELLMDGRDVIENPQISRVLTWDPKKVGTTYALKIGKTPFSPATPIHVLARGNAEIHVAQALLFEY